MLGLSRSAQKRTLQPETAATLRRTVETLLERGAVVRNLENLGERMLPYKIVTHDQHHLRGGYFLVDFDSSPIIITKLLDHLKRDIDIIRSNVLRHRVEQTEECIGITPVNYVEELQKKK